MQARGRYPHVLSIALAGMLVLPAPSYSRPAAARTAAEEVSLQALERELARVSAIAGGVVGAAAIHLESGRRASLNGGERFPMASTFKVPVAVQLLTKVDAGEIRLDDMIAIKRSDLHPGSGTLSELFNKPGVSLSVRNLLELMLLISDNSATDILVRLAGGPAAVTARMRALGIEGIDVSRPTLNLIADWVGIDALPPENEYSPEVFEARQKAVTTEEGKAAASRFEADPRDTSSPDAMAALLLKIYRKEAVSGASCDLLLDIMRRCQTGEARLKGMLPAGTEVSHKTGSIGGTTNDVGIITLPAGAGHAIVAVFVRSSDKDVADRERGVAEIARTVYDYFLFHPQTGS